MQYAKCTQYLSQLYKLQISLCGGGGSGKKNLVNQLKLILLRIVTKFCLFLHVFLQIFWLKIIGDDIWVVRVKNWYIRRIYTCVSV